MDVDDGADARIVVERARRDDDFGIAVLQHRHVGAADPAEGAVVPRRGRIALDQRLAGRPAESAPVGMEERPERRPVHLAAHRAMTVVDELRLPFEFETHLPAETGPVDHDRPPANRPCRTVAGDAPAAACYEAGWRRRMRCYTRRPPR